MQPKTYKGNVVPVVHQVGGHCITNGKLLFKDVPWDERMPPGGGKYKVQEVVVWLPQEFGRPFTDDNDVLHLAYGLVKLYRYRDDRDKFFCSRRPRELDIGMLMLPETEYIYLADVYGKDCFFMSVHDLFIEHPHTL